MADTTDPPSAGPETAEPARFWPNGWWKLMELRIGVIPLPVVIVLSVLR